MKTIQTFIAGLFHVILNLVVQSVCVACRRLLLWKQLLTVPPASEKSVESVAFKNLLKFCAFLTLQWLRKTLGSQKNELSWEQCNRFHEL